MTQSPPHMAEPVVAFGQADRDYRQAEGLSQSMMKEMLVSPAHFQHRYGPNAEPFRPTAAMIMGTAGHVNTLEPDQFDKQYCSSKEKFTISRLKELLDERGEEYKKTAKLAELQAQAFPDGEPTDHRTPLSPDNMAAVKSMTEALRSHDIAGNWFSPGQVDYVKHNEVSIYTRNELGQVLKGRIDRLDIDRERGVINIIDLKTTVDASFKAFQRTAANLHYDLQAAWYTDLVRRAFCRGIDLSVEFIFVVVERSQPHGIGIYKADDDFIMSGRRKMEETTDLHARCLELDWWPGYDPVIKSLSMPSWAEQQETEAQF